MGPIRPPTARENEPTHYVKKTLEPLVGIEPTTYSLRMNCSTPELQRPNSLCGGRFLAKASRLATVIFEYVLVVSQSPRFGPFTDTPNNFPQLGISSTFHNSNP